MIYIMKWGDGTTHLIKAASENAAWLVADSLSDPNGEDCVMLKVADREWMIEIKGEPDYDHEYNPEVFRDEKLGLNLEVQ